MPTPEEAADSFEASNDDVSSRKILFSAQGKRRRVRVEPVKIGRWKRTFSSCVLRRNETIRMLSARGRSDVS